MKLPTLKQARQRAAILLVVAVAVVAVVVIGYTTWRIFQALSKLGRTTTNRQQQIEIATGEAKSNLVSQIVGEYPQQPYQFVSLQTNLVTEITPFDPVTESVWIERSTNLVDWERLKLLAPGEAWSDPAPPWPCGFYRRTVP